MGKHVAGGRSRAVVDWSRIRGDILDRLDVEAEYESLGLVFAGPAGPNGFRPCHALGRADGSPDRNPSAAVKIAPGEPGHGVYVDRGRDVRLGFLDFALQHGKYADFLTCLKHYAARADVAVGKYETHGRNRENIVEAVYEYRDAGGELRYASFRLIRPDGSKGFSQAPWKGGRWERGPKCMEGVRPLPYRLPELLAARAANPGVVVFIVEGEKDAERLRALGLVATTNHQGSHSTDRTWPHFLRYFVGAVVVVIADNDPDGRTHAAKVCSYLDGIAASVRLVTLPGLPPKGDVSDWMDAGGTAEGLWRLVAASAPWAGGLDVPRAESGATGRLGALPAVPRAAAPATARRVEVEDGGPAEVEAAKPLAKILTFKDVTAEVVRWLIPGMIPAGKMTLVAGAADLGKSWAALDLAARISVGGLIPAGGGARFEVGDTLILAAEDGAADTIKPRFTAAGGDVKRLHTIEWIMDGKTETGFTLDFIEHLVYVLGRLPDVTTLLFDPIISFLGLGRDPNRAADVRAVLEPLRLVIEGRGITTVSIAHPNKAGAPSAIDRISGSGALAQLARAVFMVFPDKETRGRRVLLPVKNNLARDKFGLAYRIGDNPQGEAVVIWEPDPVAMTAQEWIDDHEAEGGGGFGGMGGNGGGRGGRPAMPREEVIEWLRDYLREHGTTESGVVFAAAKDAGIGRGRLYECRELAGDIAANRDREKRGKVWLWTLEGFERPTNGEPFA